MDGVIVVDKPAGITSHDVVDRVRKTLAMRKVGHAGTLDPEATGLLIVGIGRATRFLSYAQAAPKRYTATALWGVETDTQDAWGQVTATKRVNIGEAEVAAALQRFTGEIAQVPPMVSAVKIEGERLYRKARRGEVVDRPARRAHVLSLRQLSFDEGAAASTLDVTCSAGTYVRTLIHDIGHALGCGGHMASLRRTEAGGFTLADAVALDALSQSDVLPLREAVRVLETLEIDADSAEAAAHGRPLELETQASPVALVSEGRLVAVYRRTEAGLVPDRVVAV